MSRGEGERQRTGSMSASVTNVVKRPGSRSRMFLPSFPEFATGMDAVLWMVAFERAVRTDGGNPPRETETGAFKAIGDLLG